MLNVSIDTKPVILGQLSPDNLLAHTEKKVKNQEKQNTKSSLMWEIGRRLGHYGDHPCPQVADRGTPSRVDKRVAPDREGAADKQCQGEGKLWSQYVITNREEGKGKPPRLFPKTGYPLRYPEPALRQKTGEREQGLEGRVASLRDFGGGNIARICRRQLKLVVCYWWLI